MVTNATSLCSPQERWLLALDLGCSQCSRAASSIRAVTNGRIEVRGLGEAEIQGLRVNSGASEWTPALLHITDTTVVEWTRFRLGSELVKLFGVRNAAVILRAIGDSVKHSPHVIKPERRLLLKSVPSVVLGGLIATSALTATAAHADSASLNAWLFGSDAKRICNAARQAPTVQALTKKLIDMGYKEHPEHDVAAEDLTDNAALLSFYNADKKQFALIKHVNGSRTKTEAELVSFSNKQAELAGVLRPEGTVAPYDWNSFIDCVALFCPVCAAACWATGPGYAACLISCCVGGIATCGIFN